MDFLNKMKIGSLCLELLVCLFLAVTTLAVFWQLTNCGFVFIDDPVYVTNNPHVQAGLRGEGILWALTTTHADFWHPLTWLSYMLDCQLFGLRAGMFHLTNLLFHVATSILLFLVFRRMTGALWPSAFVAAMFALHPLHVEPVAWIAQRKDVLSTYFWVLTMWAYARYAERPRLNRYFLVLLFLALGLMAKPMLVTLPFVLLLLDYWPLGRFQFGQSGGTDSQQRSLAFRLLLEKIPFFVLSAALSIVTYLVQQSRGVLPSLGSFPLTPRIANALVSYVIYIRKMIWPDCLAVFYPHPSRLSWWQVAGSCLLLISISSLVIRAFRRFPYLPIGWLWYIGTLVPVIGLVKFGGHGMGDRYTYVPLIGIFVIIAWGVPDLVARWHYKNIGLATIAASVLSVLMVITWLQVQYWTNNFTLFEHALDVTDNNYVAHTNLGIALKNNGRTAEAIGHFTEVLRLRPDYVQAHDNLGNILVAQGKVDEAIYHYFEALRINPNHMKAHNNLGNVLVAQGKVDEAIFHYSEALRINPDFAEVQHNLGVALFRKGKIKEAISCFQEALRIRPDFPNAYYKLKSALVAQAKLDDTIAKARE
jgi:Flp pilus assembly protein TadD